jgi:hypothetical protein
VNTYRGNFVGIDGSVWPIQVTDDPGAKLPTFTIRSEDLELPPPDPFYEIQARQLDAFIMAEAKKDAADWDVSFWHHDVDGRWWITHPDGTVTEHFQ